MKTFVLNGWASSEEAWGLCLFERERIFTYAELLDGVAEDVLEKEKEFVLVGWSMGGSFALRYAMKFPEKLKGLILVAATPRMMRDKNWEGMTPRRLAALEMGLKMTKGEGFFGTPEDRPNPYRIDNDENLARGLEYLKSTDLRLDLIDLLASGKVRCPVYIFQSEADGIVRAQNAKFLSTVFPQAELEMIPGGEHALPVSIPEKIDVAVAGCVL
ncbi:MAG: alpha/beta fold hydrolase [Kiritimatiellae bacterium]|nr:alpha/beta fold hydrolase [Kiritimatiellia bacterium]